MPSHGAVQADSQGLRSLLRFACPPIHGVVRLWPRVALGTSSVLLCLSEGSKSCPIGAGFGCSSEQIGESLRMPDVIVRLSSGRVTSRAIGALGPAVVAIIEGLFGTRVHVDHSRSP